MPMRNEHQKRFMGHTLYDKNKCFRTYVNIAIKVENRSEHALITGLKFHMES